MKQEIKNKIGAITILIVTAFILAQMCRTTDEPKQLTPKQKMEAQFSQWDGSNRILVDTVDDYLRAPDSFEHIETRFVIRDYDMTVFMHFTAMNEFGAPLRHSVSANITADGKLSDLQFFEQ